MSTTLEQIRELYAEAFRWYDAKRAVPVINVTFYPYVGLNNTIRIRGGAVFVRISELSREMPLAGHRGLAYILMGKLLGKRIPKGAREVYSSYINSEGVRERVAANRKAKGRKVVTTSAGTVYDLEAIFDDINSRYFRDAIPKPTLTWSARKTFRILGHHDAHHDHITISRSLDAREVPQYVVEYVIFHEMLHIAHPVRRINGRRYMHTPAFKRDEEKFQYYLQAEKWIRDNVRRLKRNAKA